MICITSYTNIDLYLYINNDDDFNLLISTNNSANLLSKE